MDKKFNIKSLNTSTLIYFNEKNTETDLGDIKILLESDARLNVFPNDENNDQNNSYENICNYIYGIINQSNFLCKGLNADFIKDSFDDSDAIIVIGSKGMNILPNGNVFSFALLKFNETDNSLYIDVICSHSGTKYSGEILINEIEYISKLLLITKITLKSVKSAISFYEKYGFVKITNCDDDNLCEMKKIVTNKSTGGKNRKTHKNRKTNKKNKQTRKKRIRRK